MTALTAQDVSVRWNDKSILEHISLSISQGKRTAVIGPNGCGKSTLLKLLSGLNRQYEGTVCVEGRDIRKIPRKELARRLAILPQGAAVPADMTVEELVSYGRFPYRSAFFRGNAKRDKEVIETVMEKTRICHLASRMVQNLSGGERQRAWIAMALAQEPHILLLDEPTTYLDIAHQLEVMQTVSELNRKEKITVVMVLHDINHARMYADEVIVIKDKGVYAQGTPKEILNVENLAAIFGVRAKRYHDEDGKDEIVFPTALLEEGDDL